MLKKNLVIGIVAGLVLVPTISFAAKLKLRVWAEPTIEVRVDPPIKMGGGAAVTTISPNYAQVVNSGFDTAYDINVPESNYPTIVFPLHFYKDGKFLIDGRIVCLINRRDQKWECTTSSFKLDALVVEVSGYGLLDGGNFNFKFKALY